MVIASRLKSLSRRADASFSFFFFFQLRDLLPSADIKTRVPLRGLRSGDHALTSKLMTSSGINDDCFRAWNKKGRADKPHANLACICWRRVNNLDSKIAQFKEELKIRKNNSRYFIAYFFNYKDNKQIGKIILSRLLQSICDR